MITNCLFIVHPNHLFFMFGTKDVYNHFDSEVEAKTLYSSSKQNFKAFQLNTVLYWTIVSKYMASLLSKQQYQNSMIDVQSSQRQVRKKYTKVNGCTHPPSLIQVFAIFFILVIITLQANILSLIVDISHAILTTIMALSYLILLLIIYDYIKMIIIDPVDPRVLNQSFKQHTRDKNLLIWCSSCGVDVHKYSYHCKRCDRCVQEFDHHCKYVNNCIGRQNYMHFFRIVISLIVYLILQIGQGLWVIIMSFDNKRWVGVPIVVISGFILPSLIYLAVFHCYISFFEYGTTLRYLKGDLSAQKSKSEQRRSQADQNLHQNKRESRNSKGEDILIQIPQLPQMIVENVQSATHLHKKTYYLF